MNTIEIHKMPGTIRLGAKVWHASRAKKNNTAELPWPDLKYVRPDVIIDKRKVHAYSKVCGHINEYTVPPLLPHIEAFPLAMMIFSSARFPFSAVGLIHLANTVTLHRQIRIGDRLRFEVQTGELFRHAKGQVLSLHAKASHQGRPVWQSSWTFLKIKHKTPAGADYVSDLADFPVLSKQAEIYANGRTIRRYGLVAGDINPIHMHSVSARLMGLKTSIAHGMWTKARVLSLLAPQVSFNACGISVEFKSPVMLPSTIVLWAKRVEQHTFFEVRSESGELTHMRGSINYPGRSSDV